MPREESEYLLDMVLAATKAVSFTEGMSFADFARDERTVFSATKAVEIVGEAAAQVSGDTRQAHPDIPWRDIISSPCEIVSCMPISRSTWNSSGERFVTTCRI